MNDYITEMLLETCDHKTCIGYEVETERDTDGTPCGQIQVWCPCKCHDKDKPNSYP